MKNHWTFGKKLISRRAQNSINRDQHSCKHFTKQTHENNPQRLDTVLHDTKTRHLKKKKGSPGSSAGKESTCSAKGPGLTSGSGGSSGEGIGYSLQYSWASVVAQLVKESACNVGGLGLIPGLGRSPGGGHGNPLQYSCLENPHRQRSLMGCSPWGCKESNTTEWLSTYGKKRSKEQKRGRKVKTQNLRRQEWRMEWKK